MSDSDAHDRIFGRYHVCPACLARRLRVGRTKHDTIFTACDRCRTRSFLNSVESLTGLALLDGLLTPHNDKVETSDDYRTSCDVAVQRFKDDLRLALREPDDKPKTRRALIADALDMRAKDG